VIRWDDAVLFANWSGKRLPTSAEWQRVAAGPEGRAFAWGEEFDPEAVDLSHSLAAAALETMEKDGQFVFTPLDIDTLAGVEVDDPARNAGATAAADGDPVYRLPDNVSEWVEDLYVDWNRDGYPETTVATSVVRTTRGSNFQFILPDACGTGQRDGSISVSYGRDQTLGLRCVKTRLDPEFLRSD
jgi:formylglycine-generating enzyme required for sulfatase activity